MNLTQYILSGFCILTCGVFIGIGAASAQPTSAPRTQQSDFTYLGAFALPKGNFGDSRFGYGGNGLAYYKDLSNGKQTLFMEGHAWYPGNVAQVEIPSALVISDEWDELPLASVLQPFNHIMDGRSGTLNNNAGGNNFVYGMLAYNNRLIVAASNYYDAGGSQDRSHGVSTFNLATTDDFQGFFAVDADAPPRALGGYMTTIPAEWRSLLGGPALTGNCCLSIIGNSSSGPAVSVFNPDDLGVRDPVPGTTMLFHPLSHPYTDDFNAQTGSQVVGVAFPAGTRSVLFIGRNSNVDYCYGPGTDDPALHKVPTEGGTWCYDLCNHSKGGHGYPYYHKVWAYDANDLLAVKNGQKQSWEVTPYASWRLNDMETDGCAGIRSASYDPQVSRLYITQGFSEEPRVDVYQIALPGGPPGSAPNPPMNLRRIP